MSRSVVTGSLLVFLKHGVVSLGVTLLLVVKALLKTLFFLLIESLQLGELVLGLALDLLDGQFLLIFLLLQLLLELLNLCVVSG